jgi:hypothetical protein
VTKKDNEEEEPSQEEAKRNMESPKTGALHSVNKRDSLLLLDTEATLEL